MKIRERWPKPEVICIAVGIIMLDIVVYLLLELLLLDHGVLYGQNRSSFPLENVFSQEELILYATNLWYLLNALLVCTIFYRFWRS